MSSYVFIYILHRFVREMLCLVLRAYFLSFNSAGQPKRENEVSDCQPDNASKITSSWVVVQQLLFHEHIPQDETQPAPSFLFVSINRCLVWSAAHLAHKLL